MGKSTVENQTFQFSGATLSIASTLLSQFFATAAKSFWVKLQSQIVLYQVSTSVLAKNNESLNSDIVAYSKINLL